jgi:hypothetical protein
VVQLPQAASEQREQRLMPRLAPEHDSSEADLVGQRQAGPPSALSEESGHHLRPSTHHQRGQRVATAVVTADAAGPGARRDPQLIQLRPARRQLQQFDGAANAPHTIQDKSIASLSRG